MILREALVTDIKELFSVRMSVKENVLVTLELVTDEICEDYLARRGKGWVCEMNSTIAGFAITDLIDDSIWALFVRPEYEGKQIGKSLQILMLNWYFKQGKEKVWLYTAPHTRAETFYRRTGWTETDRNSQGEIKFEMTAWEWKNKNMSNQ